MDGLIARSQKLDEQMRARERSGGISPIAAQRHRDIMNYIAHPEWEPALMAAKLPMPRYCL